MQIEERFVFNLCSYSLPFFVFARERYCGMFILTLLQCLFFLRQTGAYTYKYKYRINSSQLLTNSFFDSTRFWSPRYARGAARIILTG